ncbi:hypothetical protein GOP47_0028277 [Adiantum capillus-veneris]|nr:hypothetical protein GOP47_0028277 [Adiantum capillus-veneris]
MSTISTPSILPNPVQDCADLFRAFKGFGCDDKKLIEILGHRNYAQRHELRQAYRNLYSDDLLRRLKSELRGNFERTVLLWMEDAADRDAIIIRDALKGWGTKDLALIEMICTRTGSQLQVIRQAYNTRFHRSLDEDIASDTSGDYKKLLLAYLNNYRPETPQVNMQLAQADCRELYRAGEGRLGTDEAAIISIITSRSSAQLNACFNMYKQTYGHDIEKAMKRETSGNFLNALRTIVKCVHFPAKYFAKVLYKSMKGMGTDDATLIRVVVTRAEIDMQYIKAEFVRKYQKRLDDMISSDTSGSYKKFLLALIGSNKM